jgi:hypothetical protein
MNAVIRIDGAKSTAAQAWREVRQCHVASKWLLLNLHANRLVILGSNQGSAVSARQYNPKTADSEPRPLYQPRPNPAQTRNQLNATVEAEALTLSRHFGSSHLLALAGDDYNWRSHVTASDVILKPAAEIAVTHI